MKRSTLVLLRFPFSLLLMPVFLFALSTIPAPDIPSLLLAFFIIHVLVYPSSNGYNSYEDRDESPVGGIAAPPLPEKELWTVTIIMDLMAVLLGLWVSLYFAAGIFIYIFFSRAYSWRGIRLKKYPVAGYLTVVLNQGALIYWITREAGGSSSGFLWPGMASASLLIGGFYPLTQIYQHDTDRADGVKTISMLLGKKGTFLFCGIIYALAFGMLYLHFQQQNRLLFWYVLQLFFAPVGLAFGLWAYRVFRNPERADFKHTMKLNLVAALGTNLAFITLIILNYFGLH